MFSVSGSLPAESRLSNIECSFASCCVFVEALERRECDDEELSPLVDGGEDGESAGSELDSGAASEELSTAGAV